MSDHVWVQENLDAYLADDLTPDERAAIESHTAACATCEQELAEVRDFGGAMDRLFGATRPDAKLEERVLAHIRSEPPLRRARPGMWRFFGAAAAVVLLGIVGAIVQSVTMGGLPFLEADRVVSNQKADAKQIGLAMHGYSELHNLRTAEEKVKVEEILKSLQGGLGNTFDSLKDKEKAEHQQGESKELTDKAKGPVPMAKSAPDGQMPPYVGGVPPMTLPPPGGNPRGQGGAMETRTPGTGMPGMGMGGIGIPGMSNGGWFGGPALPNASYTSQGKSTLSPATTQYYEDAQQGQAKGGEGKEGGLSYYESREKTTNARPGNDDTRDSYLKPGRTTKDDPKGERPFADGDKKAEGTAPPPPSVPAISPPPSPSYFTPPVPVAPAVVVPTTGPRPGDGKSDDAIASIATGGDKGEKKPDESAKPKPDPAKKLPPVEQPEPPVDTGRKIIRTGEMEFEIDSFYGAVDKITDLLRLKTKGGFIATINSDKLPNGKMRGSIVVRMPPQYLDDFLKDLRAELGKVGELKGQRIGSQDVTKAYTDTESELRAARAVESRLIEIIKTGKGEIKDLIAAERELGVWRTRIEKMEGELRYYNNQVALSTVTISLYEKEIQAPSAIVITERVGMRLEVDDVALAHEAALKAVADAKGRVTKSELKQHAVGQLEAILHAEIAPANRDKFTVEIKKLGIVSHHDAQRLQQAEGGIGRPIELKLRQSDVRFEIAIHDLVNIRPRHSTTLQVAAHDVPEQFNKLRDEIVRVKGQIRVGQLNEQDKLSINAQLDFNVPSSEKANIDKLIAEFATVLSRTNTQAPLNELSTERKFGYSLVIRDFVSIPAKHSISLQVATPEVASLYQRLQLAIRAVKGHVRIGQLNEHDKNNITAQLDFSVMSADKPTIDKLLEGKVGESNGVTVLARQNLEAPASGVATEQKFGYTVMLRDFANIPPSKATEMTLAASDVASNYAKLIEAINKAKGQVGENRLNEQDKLNISAHVKFMVPTSEKPTIDKLLAEMGTPLSRNNVQAPASELTTDRKFGYSVVLRDFASIPPRETFTLQLAAIDVQESFRDLQEAVAQAKGTVQLAQVVEDSKTSIAARFDFNVSSANRQAVEAKIAKTGATLSRSSTQVPAHDLATDQKVGYSLTLRSTGNIPPRDKTLIKVEVDDVDAEVLRLKNLVGAGKGRVVDSTIDRQENGKVAAILVLEVPLASQDAIIQMIKGSHKLASQKTVRNQQVPENDLATAQITMVLTGITPIVPSDEGFASYINRSLSISFRFFAYGMMFIIIGLSTVLPWALALFLVYKLYVRMNKPTVEPTVEAAKVVSPPPTENVSSTEPPKA